MDILGSSKKRAQPPDTLITLLDQKSPVTEAFRTLRANLVAADVDTPRRKLLVTSTVAKEGKSTAVANLGVVMAMAGSRTLIVDGDLRRPTQHRVFQVSAKVGLTSVLIGQAELQQAIQATKLPALHLLPSGPAVPNPTDLLGSRRMTELVEKLQADYEYVLFDSPPVTTGADALILVGISDGVLLVIGSGRAPQKIVARAAKHLESVHANLLGALLMGFDFRREGYYGSYYHAYAYGYRREEG